jgi:hypothetical protein
LIFYLGAAAALLSAADALNRQDCRLRWRELVYEWLLTTLGLAVPATVAFSIGIVAGYAGGIAKADAPVTIGSTASFAFFASELEDRGRLAND